MEDQTPAQAPRPRILGQNQNLINQVKIQDIEPVIKPQGFYKSIALNAASILVAFALGYAYFRFLDGTWPWWPLMLAGTMLGVASVFQTLLVPSFWRRAGFVIIETIALFIPFYAFDRTMLGVSISLVFIFFLLGYLESRREFDHETSIRFFRVTHGVIAKMTTGVLLAGVLLGLPTITIKNSLISEPQFNTFFDWTVGVMHSFYPELSLSGTFGDFTQSIAKGQLKNNEAFRALSEEAQNAAVQAASAQVSASLSKSLGVTISSTNTTGEVTYQFIMRNIEAWQSRAPLFFMIGWGILLFLVLRSAGVIFIWITQIATMIVYEIFLATSFLRIVEQPQTKEVVEY